MGVRETGDPNIYKIDSDTSDREYMVDTTKDEEWTCTCTGYATSRNKAVKNERERLPWGWYNRHTGETQHGKCKHLETIGATRSSAVRNRQREQDAEFEAKKAELQGQAAKEGLIQTLRELSQGG